MDNITNSEKEGEFQEELKHLHEEIQHEKAEIEHEKKELDYLEKELEELEKHEPKEVTLFVNSEPKEWCKETISFEEVVVLAFGVYDPNPDIIYTVTYSKGVDKKPSGSMEKGDVIKVKNKENFNVTRANRS